QRRHVLEINFFDDEGAEDSLLARIEREFDGGFTGALELNAFTHHVVTSGKSKRGDDLSAGEAHAGFYAAAFRVQHNDVVACVLKRNRLKGRLRLDLSQLQLRGPKLLKDCAEQRVKEFLFKRD